MFQFHTCPLFNFSHYFERYRRLDKLARSAPARPIFISLYLIRPPFESYVTFTTNFFILFYNCHVIHMPLSHLDAVCVKSWFFLFSLYLFRLSRSSRSRLHSPTATAARTHAHLLDPSVHPSVCRLRLAPSFARSSTPHAARRTPPPLHARTPRTQQHDMPKAKKTRKFAAVKRMISPADARL